jgi:hypothetical protein
MLNVGSAARTAAAMADAHARLQCRLAGANYVGNMSLARGLTPPFLFRSCIRR